MSQTKSLPIKNPQLLEEALTHRSYLNENPTVKTHNERLEILCDAFLELVVSEFLYNKFTDKPEGELTASRAAAGRTTPLATLAHTLALGQQLKLSKGEEFTGGRTNISLLANTLEAVIGAVYLDTGYDTAQTFITKHLLPQIDEIIEQKLFKDYKSTLQEAVQSQGSMSPEYQVVSESGPDHDKNFTIRVLVNGSEVAQGQGKSKQAAQQAAAQRALEILKLS